VTACVLPEHVSRFRRYADYRARFSGAFHAGMLAATLATLAGALVPVAELVAAGLCVFGVIIWVFPFATPATLVIHGAATSIRIARAGAALLALLGLGTFLALVR